MDILPLDQQKKAVLYAPKDLLWRLAEAEEAWLKVFKVLPEEYYTQFLGRLRLLGVVDPNQMKNMAKLYVQSKVQTDHLQRALAAAWNPSDLEEGTSFLKENEFLDRLPEVPLNLQASSEEIASVVTAASKMSAATKMRLARAGHSTAPKVGNPPDGASPAATKCWNQVLKDPKRRKVILAPSKVEDQWGLAHKFWLQECAKQGVPAYKSPAGGSSSSMQASSSLKRSFHEMHNSLCSGGYTMSRPASRLMRKLFDQLVADGNDMGSWDPVRPKTPKGI